ncbi:MAG: CDP-diacylglycerol--inositol 3-phosphatidyltransferase [Promethearchaeota archaeon]|nr:MAG: CDP-diacylglycerol--inositol 3-phosphatidyltransferase [Candidatus Lokiarchaeota archaeon]
MPSKFRLRYIFKPLIKGIAKPLSKTGFTANMATGVMFLNAILSFVFLVVLFKNLILFSIFVFLTGIFDGVDGAIARLRNTQSAYGGFFDSFMDRLSEFVIFLALLIHFWDQKLWNIIDISFIMLISLVSSIMISYSRAKAESLFEGDFDIGLMARSERLFYLFITMIITFFIGYGLYFLFLFMLLVSLTALFRGIKIYRGIKTGIYQQKLY